MHPKTYATFVPVLIIYILKRYDENADDKYAINLYPDRM